MDLDYFITRFARNAETIAGMVNDVDATQARWRPEPSEWSILEVINHLYDEEREDFRARLEMLLHHPDKRWPGIDPPAWAIERQYQERDLTDSLNHFLAERQFSLSWLKELSDPHWEAVYDHPAGKIRAGDLLASWLAHDYLHIRQLAGLHHAYVTRQAEPFGTIYAGEW